MLSEELRRYLEQLRNCPPAIITALEAKETK